MIQQKAQTSAIYDEKHKVIYPMRTSIAIKLKRYYGNTYRKYKMSYRPLPDNLTLKLSTIRKRQQEGKISGSGDESIFNLTIKRRLISLKI